ncbi:MAG: hypothetical protein AAB796_00500, partial [Patescibacteria group bacterium]
MEHQSLNDIGKKYNLNPDYLRVLISRKKLKGVKINNAWTTTNEWIREYQQSAKDWRELQKQVGVPNSRKKGEKTVIIKKVPRPHSATEGASFKKNEPLPSSAVSVPLRGEVSFPVSSFQKSQIFLTSFDEEFLGLQNAQKPEIVFSLKSDQSFRVIDSVKQFQWKNFFSFAGNLGSLFGYKNYIAVSLVIITLIFGIPFLVSRINGTEGNIQLSKTSSSVKINSSEYQSSILTPFGQSLFSSNHGNPRARREEQSSYDGGGILTPFGQKIVSSINSFVANLFTPSPKKLVLTNSQLNETSSSVPPSSPAIESPSTSAMNPVPSPSES